tara:strand:+ start:2651 stop:3070 length:420 start_codon:yes stop_codon:yes gene_type:complete
MPYGKKSPATMGHSPLEGHCMGSAAKMGHDSPAQNHHYGTRKGESVKQEKYNLMNDNPVARDASGGRSWMSKHSKSAMMMKGPMKMGHEGSPAKHEMKDPTKGTHWHATDGSVVTEKKGKKHKQKLPTGPNVPAQMKYD